MNRTLISSLIVITLAFCSLGWTTKQETVIKNCTRQQIVQHLEEFVAMNGYKFEVSNNDKGLFEIFVKQTGGDSVFVPMGNTFLYTTNPITNWIFTLNILEDGKDVVIKGISRGGIAPGKYYKQFIDTLKSEGFLVLEGKNVQKIPQDKNVTTSSGTINTDTPKDSNDVTNRGPDVGAILSDLELKTFNKNNLNLSISDRLGLLELYYFNNQLTNLSVQARIQALENKMSQMNSSN